MAVFLALPLWRFIFRNRSRPASISALGQASSQEDHVVYLDQDSILLPTVPPPPYAKVDPNPIILRARRPVAVLAVIESVETTETRDARDGDGLSRVEELGNNEGRRTSITLKPGRNEWQLSLKAVLSVGIFLLAIVGIAWRGSMAVAYTWPTKDILAEDSSLKHTVRSIYESLLEAGNPQEATSQEASQVNLAEISPSAAISSYEESSTTSSVPSSPLTTALTDLDLDIITKYLSTETLAQVREHIGHQPIYDCRSHKHFMEGRTDELDAEYELWDKTGVRAFYNKPKDFWCVMWIHIDTCTCTTVPTASRPAVAATRYASQKV